MTRPYPGPYMPHCSYERDAAGLWSLVWDSFGALVSRTLVHR